MAQPHAAKFSRTRSAQNLNIPTRKQQRQSASIILLLPLFLNIDERMAETREEQADVKLLAGSGVTLVYDSAAPG